MKAKRRIRSAKIRFLSLCPRGKNNVETVFNADDTFEISMVVNGFDKAKGELTFVAYAPEMPDTDGRIADAETIKAMMYDAAQNGLSLDIRHDFMPIPKDKAFIAESFIVNEGDTRFKNFKDYSGKKIDVTGAWGGIIKILDQDLIKKYAEEDWRGVSMAGLAITEPITNEGDSPMTEAEIKALTTGLAAAVAEANKPLVELVTNAMKPKEPEKKAPAKREFVAAEYKGDITDDLALEKFSLEQCLRKMSHELDKTDIDAVRAFTAETREIRTRLDEIKNEMESRKADKGDADAKQAEILRLKQRINTLQGKSSQPTKGAKDDDFKGETINLSADSEADAANDLAHEMGLGGKIRFAG